MSDPATTTKTSYKVKGMDCAACATKIETAVKRIDGVSDVRVGLHTETLSLGLASAEAGAQVEKAVSSLGYAITPKHSLGTSTGPKHDHDYDHGAPIEGPWWKSPRGIAVIVTGALVALAYVERSVFGLASHYVFLPAAAVGTYPVAKRAFQALRAGALFTIEMLMSIAVIGAIVIGAIDEAAIVVFLFAVGELLEAVAAGQARSGIRALGQIAPTTAMLETDAGLVETAIAQIEVGAVVVVRPGDRVPADGTIIEGSSSVDESALTGESMPRSKTKGDLVLAGSINNEAVLRVRVEKPAEDTLIARVIRLVEEAANAKAPSERFIDQFARWYMPAICLLAIAVAVLPPLFGQGSWDVWLYRALALLLIGCPCALVISTPASIASALAAGARHGLLVKGGGVLEAIGKVRHIAFDKTGTLTAGKPRVTDVEPHGAYDANAVLRLAAAIESGSSHPLAMAIVTRAAELGLTYTAVASEVLPGKGIVGRAEGKIVTIGAASRLRVTNAAVLSRSAELEAEGKSVSVVLVGHEPIGLIALRDEPRDDAILGIAQIKALGLMPVMLTGDNRANAEAVGRLLGMEVRAELLPEDKLAYIKQRESDGGIAKVGDGINDAPALAAATVGIAMGSGTDVALEAADAAVLNNRVTDVADLIKLSRRAMSVIRQNVAIALGLKAVFLVTTIMGLTGLWIAILADTGATVLVTLNALRLLRKL